VSANTRAEALHLGDQALSVEAIKVLVDVHDSQDKTAADRDFEAPNIKG
jgi:hypothetical protein